MRGKVEKKGREKCGTAAEQEKGQLIATPTGTMAPQMVSYLKERGIDSRLGMKSSHCLSNNHTIHTCVLESEVHMGQSLLLLTSTVLESSSSRAQKRPDPEHMPDTGLLQRQYPRPAYSRGTFQFSLLNSQSCILLQMYV